MSHDFKAGAILDSWLTLKNIERDAAEQRRNLEDALLLMMEIDQASEGSNSFELMGHKVTITIRMNRKVDADKLQELATELGYGDLLPSLCRWKPELNLKAWKSTDPTITQALASAIETKPGRPSFKIELNEE